MPLTTGPYANNLVYRVFNMAYVIPLSLLEIDWRFPNPKSAGVARTHSLLPFEGRL